MDEWDKRIEREAKQRLEENLTDSSFAIRYEGVKAAVHWDRYQEQQLQEAEATLQPLRDAVRQAQRVTHDIIALLYGIEPRYLETARFWECKYSPTGHCIYNTKDDRSKDCCVVCHEPSERK